MRRPDAIAATADHYVPTAGGRAAIADPDVRAMVDAMARHTARARHSVLPAPATRVRASCT